jgi:hypothetical protein
MDSLQVKRRYYNVKDGRGKVKDYVKYFKALPIDRDEATQSGLLQTAIGRNAFSIANAGSDELIASHSAAQITDQAAVQIAQAAPNDSSLQAVGMRQVLDGKPGSSSKYNACCQVNGVRRSTKSKRRYV